MTKRLVIGLTGSIGCGKSTVMKTLAALGAHGIDADRVAHAVIAPGGPAYAPVVAEFGAELLAPGGEISREQLGKRVFADPAALARLEGIVHPAVGEAIRAEVEAATAPVVAIEAIKLLEANLSRLLCDQVWVVTCSPEEQVARLAASRGMSPAEVARRRAAQMPQDAMAAQADRVIETSGTVAATRVRVLEAWLECRLPLPPVEMRPAAPTDAAGIAEVLNSIISEAGLTVLDRVVTVEEEQSFLRALPARARLTIAKVGPVVAGFQVLEPYASWSGALAHVATLGTYVLASLRRRGIGRALADATFAFVRGAGYGKVVVNVRADNPGAQAYYASLGFLRCGRLARQAFVDGHYVDEVLFERFLEA